MKNRKDVDLHAHTNASDGSLTPTELVRFALKKGLEAIAITDHDTVAGVEEALRAGKRYGLEVVPGVEISCYLKEREFHLLGLYIDHRNKELRRTLKKLSDNRVNYIKNVLKNLNCELKKEGIHQEIRFEDVLKYTKEATSIGRPMIAKAMIEKRIVKDHREAFDKYLSKKEILVPKSHFSIEDAIRMVHKAKGLAILAHPLLQYEIREKEQMASPSILKWFCQNLNDLKKKGLDGMECYFAFTPSKEKRYLLDISKKLGLIASGGSDWHGNESSYDLGSLKIPYHVLEKLKSYKRRI